MSTKTQSFRKPLQAHWFFFVAVLVIVVNASAILLDRWESPRLLEAGLLFDFAVLIPLLYLICYRAEGKRVAIRTIALACLGIWVVGHVVPEQNHYLLQRLGFVRYLGLSVLVILEIKLVVAIYRAAFNSETTAEKEASMAVIESGAPQWVTRLIAWEASIWLKVWSFVRRLVGKK